MNELLAGAHPHLLVNHVPILGAFFALGLLVASYFVGGDVLRRTGFAFLIVTALAAGASDLSGDPAVEATKGLPGITRNAVHAHEDSAGKAFFVAGVVGVLALGALIRWRRTPVPASATLTLLVATVILSGMMAWTGLLGGQVRHTEVRPGATPAAATIIEPPRARGAPKNDE